MIYIYIYLGINLIFTVDYFRFLRKERYEIDKEAKTELVLQFLFGIVMILLLLFGFRKLVSDFLDKIHKLLYGI